jgi:hypothetical protein
VPGPASTNLNLAASRMATAQQRSLCSTHLRSARQKQGDLQSWIRTSFALQVEHRNLTINLGGNMARAPNQLFVNGNTRFSAFPCAITQPPKLRCTTVKSLDDGVPCAIPFGTQSGRQETKTAWTLASAAPRNQISRGRSGRTRDPHLASASQFNGGWILVCALFPSPTLIPSFQVLILLWPYFAA